jgi:hypothetical protein
MTRRWFAPLAALCLVVSSGCNAKLPDPDSPGARLYASRCNGCHRLYAPGLMSEEMWRITVKRMQGELARRGLAPLSGEEEALLLDYLRRHSYSLGEKPA